MVSTLAGRVPFQCFSKIPQQRSTGLYLLWVWWIVQKVDGFLNAVGEFHHPFEKPGSAPVAFRPVVGFDLKWSRVPFFIFGQAIVPIQQALHDKIAGFRGTPEHDAKTPVVFVHDAERGVFFGASHVVVGGPVVAPGFPSRENSPIFTAALQSML